MAEPKAARPPARKRETAKPAAPITLTTGWAAALFALLVVLFFHQVVVGGMTFVSPDATAPAGFVRMGEQALYREHVYPLWNPFVFLGMPSFGSGAYNPLIYPPDWPMAVLQKTLPLPELTWLLFYYFLGALFLYLLAREWGARPEGALLGGALFVFAPNLVAVGSHGHGSQLVDSAYIPLLLWLAARWLRRGGLQHLGWLALAGGFQLLRGHVQVCFYTWLAIALYAVVDWLATLRRPSEIAARTARAAALALAAVLAFGLAGFYNLPLQDYARYSIRSGGEGGGLGLARAMQWSLAPYELPSAVVPGWVGFGDDTYWGGMPFTNYPNVYIGMVAAVLLLPAFLANGAQRLFALLLATVAIVISFGGHFPLYRFLYDHLPLFNKFRVPVMVTVLFQVSAALGVAWGWSDVLARAGAKREETRRLERVLLGAAVVLAVAFAVGVLGQEVFRGAYVGAAVALRSQPGQPFPRELAELAYRGFVSDLGRASLLGLLGLGAAWLAVRGRLSATLASVAVLVLLLGDLWPVSGRVMKTAVGPAVQRSLDAGRDDVTEFLEKQGPPGSFRILPSPFEDPNVFLAEFQTNRYAGFGISTVGGYHAAKPRLVQDLLDTDYHRTSPIWWRLLNVRFLVAQQPIAQLPAFLRPAYQGSALVYENLAALPRATVVGAWRVVPHARAVLDSIAAFTRDPGDFTWLEKDPGILPGPVAGARAVLVSYRLNDVTVEVETPGPALLRLADLWYPDWAATVDGRPSEILRADYLLRAVAVSAGRHRVEFHYRSPAVWRGLVLSLASLGLILIVLLAPLAWRRRAQPAADEGGRA